MSARLMILCSGQGGQHPGMFDLARADAEGAAVLAQAGVRSDDAGMFDNAVAQPAIVAGTLALWSALRERLPAPALVAGYSIGELAAWAVAESLTNADAIALSRIRAAAMDGAALAGPAQALVAVSGVPVERLAGLAGFELAIVNAFDACVVGGLEADLPQLEAALVRAGGKLQRLPVAVASHTPLMQPAVAPFAAALGQRHFGAPRCPVLSGVRALALREGASAARDLAQQLVRTIRWSDCMDAAAEADIGVALELGPGAALARMLQARHPHIACRSAADFRSVAGIVRWVEQQAARH